MSKYSIFFGGPFTQVEFNALTFTVDGVSLIPINNIIALSNETVIQQNAGMIFIDVNMNLTSVSTGTLTQLLARPHVYVNPSIISVTKLQKGKMYTFALASFVNFNSIPEPKAIKKAGVSLAVAPPNLVLQDFSTSASYYAFNDTAPSSNAGSIAVVQFDVDKNAAARLAQEKMSAKAFRQQMFLNN